MLNEIKEFEQYSFDCIKNHEPGRLKHKAFIMNSFSGIGRAMTTVARYYMFLDNEKMSQLSPKAEQQALAAIKIWCGAKKPQFFSEIETVRNWLPNYIRCVLLSNQIKRFNNDTINSDCDLGKEKALINSITIYSTEEELSTIANSLQSAYDNTTDEKKRSIYKNNILSIISCIDSISGLAFRRKIYGHSMFPAIPEKTDSNDIKAITYEKIIADAFYKGPLKRYYLCCNKESLLNGFTEKEKDIILKTIASYLLNKNYNITGQQWVFINKTDIVNWLKNIHKVDNYKLNATIFQTQKLGGNIVKLCVNEDWISHFMIIEENHFNKEDWNDGIFFRDDGSQSYLIENELYQ